MYTIKFQSDVRKYKFEKNKGEISIEGTIGQITEFAIQQGVRQEELILAYSVMAKNLHTYAEFGLRGCFLFSHDGEPKNVVSMFH